MEHKKEHKKDKGMLENISSRLYNWDKTNTYTHKILVITSIFLVLTSVLLYPLITGFNNKPMRFMDSNINEINKRRSAVNKTSDSIDAVLEKIEMRKLEHYNATLEEQRKQDSLEININHLLNKKND